MVISFALLQLSVARLWFGIQTGDGSSYHVANREDN